MTLQTIRVRDYMSRKLVALSPATEILQALDTLVRKDISGAPVVDESGCLIGMLTEKDCMKVALNAAFDQQSSGLVEDFMETDIVTISAEEPIVTTVRRFYDDRYLRYPVVDGTGLVGVISRSDVMRAMGEYFRVEWDSRRV